MPAPSGAIAGWKCNDLVDYVSATHTLIGVGTAPFSDNARSGTKSLGPMSGTNHFRNASARVALSGATTWGLSFRFFSGDYSSGPQVLGIGDTNGDSIIYRVLSTGAIRAIINNSIFSDSASGIALTGRWMAGGFEFSGGVLRAYATLDNLTTNTPAVSITNAAGDFPTSGSIWFGVNGSGPTFLPFSLGYIDDIILFNTAPGSYPQVDTAPTPSVGSATEESLTVAWTDEAGVIAYDVYKHTSNDSSGATRFARVLAGKQSIVVGGLDAATPYYFWLRPVFHSQNIGGFGGVGSGTTSSAGAGPAQPTLLQATALGATQIRLNWADGADTLAQLVYQSSDSNFANATRIGLAYAGAETFLVTGLSASTPYWFWVEPVNATSAGTKSSSATATTTAAPVLSLTPSVNDLAYDLVRWLVQEALASGSVANFVDGEISSSEAQSGKIHLFAAFADDLPTDCGVVTATSIRNRLEFTPVREARVKILLRTADDETSSARVRAEAAAKAVIEFTRDESMQDKTHVSLPSGRTVLIFQDQQHSPGGMDASGRYQVLVEFRMQYLDTITQSN